MPDRFVERIARNEQAISDLRGDIVEIRSTQRDDHHRLREIEAAIKAMVEAQKNARRAEELQYQRIALRLRELSIAIALSGVVVAIVVAVLH